MEIYGIIEQPKNDIERRQNIETYKHLLQEYTTNFAQEQDNPKNLQFDPGFFPRLIYKLNFDLVRHILKNDVNLYPERHRDKYCDIELIEMLFMFYLDIVMEYKSNKRVSLLEFSVFTNIRKNVFLDWLNNYSNSSIDRTIYIKRLNLVRFILECEENSLVNDGDTIKSIFLLKAKFGYSETPQTQPDKYEQITTNQLPTFGGDALKIELK